MALATSDLLIEDILDILSITSKDAKDIFYNGSTLKTISEFGNLVSKSGLDATYCPGADADARLSNLLSDRDLSYFKGYESLSNFYTTPNPISSAGYVVILTTFIAPKTTTLKRIETLGGGTMTEIVFDIFAGDFNAGDYLGTVTDTLITLKTPLQRVTGIDLESSIWGGVDVNIPITIGNFYTIAFYSRLSVFASKTITNIKLDTSVSGSSYYTCFSREIANKNTGELAIKLYE